MLLFISLIPVFTACAQLSINPEAGVNFSLVNARSNDLPVNAQMLTGYKAGAVINLILYKGFYMEPGIFYSVKGSSFNFLAAGASVSDKMTLNYLEVPINLFYKYDFEKAGLIFGSAGPYWGVGLNGKRKSSVSGIAGEKDVQYGNGDGEIQKLILV